MTTAGFDRRTVLSALATGAAVAVVGGPAHAATTRQQAKALVAYALKRYDAQPDAVIQAINEGKDGDFRKGELYLVVQETGPNAKVVAHGADPKMKGTQLDVVKDDKGRLFALDISRKATAGGQWFKYDWMNPATGKVQPKTTWAVRHKNLVFLCGFYA